jgi:hypothetical protein
MMQFMYRLDNCVGRTSVVVGQVLWSDKCCGRTNIRSDKHRSDKCRSDKCRSDKRRSEKSRGAVIFAKIFIGLGGIRLLTSDKDYLHSKSQF